MNQTFLHHFRRNRKYARHERWAVVLGLFVLTLLIAGAGYGLNVKNQAQASNIEVESVTAPDRPIRADGHDFEEARLSLTQTGSSIPAVNVWVGLKLKDRKMTSPSLSLNNWYSPQPDRAFFQTDARGQVTFPMMSEVAGTVEYDIYLANIGEGMEASYQRLDKEFVVNYVK